MVFNQLFPFFIPVALSIATASCLNLPTNMQESLSVSLFTGFETIAKALMGCGDIGDTCIIVGCCDWALCSPYTLKCHADVPWSKTQLGPPTYKNEDARIAVGETISFEVYRRHNGGVFKGYLFQLEGMSVNGWTELGVTSNYEKRGIFHVVQADSGATRIAAATPAGQNNVYKLINQAKEDWVYINGDINDTSPSTQVNFVKGMFGEHKQSYHALWFGTTMRNDRKSALNMIGNGEGNVDDVGYTAYLQVVREQL
ncbi:hypothetical protein EV360DRAFT_85275 [Lentinula raphanica]|nr:hypothetical protein EV360DRAFT_85275 [Lentinula raphanica]